MNPKLRTRRLKLERFEDRCLLAADALTLPEMTAGISAENEAAVEASTTASETELRQDLKLTDFVAPIAASARYEQRLSVVVTRELIEQFTPIEISIWSSRDSVLDESDTRIETRVSGEQRGEKIYQFSINAWLSGSDGDQFLIAQVNESQAVDEIDYSNNTFATPIKLYEDTPAKLTGVTSDPEVSQGESFHITVSGKNPASIEYRRWTGAVEVFDEAENPVHRLDNVGLFIAPNSFHSRELRVSVPLGWPTGRYQIVASDEVDSVTTTVLVTPAVPSVASLKSSTVQPRSVPWQVEFQSPTLSGKSGIDRLETHNWQFFLSQDPWWNPTDLVIAARFEASESDPEKVVATLVPPSDGPDEVFLILRAASKTRSSDVTSVAAKVQFVGETLLANQGILLNGFYPLKSDAKSATFEVEIVNFSQQERAVSVLFNGSAGVNAPSPPLFQEVRSFDVDEQQVQRHIVVLENQTRETSVDLQTFLRVDAAGLAWSPGLPHSVEFAGPGYDFAISAIHTDEILRVGSTIRWTIENQRSVEETGAVDAPRHRANVYLSRTADLNVAELNVAELNAPDSNHVFLGRVITDQPLAFDSTNVGTFTVDELPNGFDTGFLIVSTTIHEDLFTDNNTLSIPFTAERTALEFAAPADGLLVNVGDEFLDLQVTNSGERDLDSFRYEMFFSDQPAEFPTDDWPLRFGEISEGIRRGETRSFSFGRRGRPIGPGHRYVNIRADWESTFRSIKLDAPIEEQNFALSNFQFVQLRTGRIQLSLDVENLGADTRHFSARIELHFTSTPDAVRTVTNFDTLPVDEGAEDSVFRAGEKKTLTSQMSWNYLEFFSPFLTGSYLPPGDAYLKAIVGIPNFESDFSDNEASVPVPDTRFDLEIGSVSFPDGIRLFQDTPASVEIINKSEAAVEPGDLSFQMWIWPTNEGPDPFPRLEEIVVPFDGVIQPNESTTIKTVIPSYQLQSGERLPPLDDHDSRYISVTLQNTIGERIITNNHVLLQELDFDDSAIDLQVDDVSIEVIDPDIGTVEFQWSLSNQGERPYSGTLGHRLLLSKQYRSSGSYHQIIDERHHDLAPGEVVLLRKTISVAPADLRDDFVASVRLLGELPPEPNLGNNQATYSPAPLPDPTPRLEAKILSIHREGKIELQIDNVGQVETNHAEVLVHVTRTASPGSVAFLQQRHNVYFRDAPLEDGESRVINLHTSFPEEATLRFDTLYATAIVGSHVTDAFPIRFPRPFDETLKVHFLDVSDRVAAGDLIHGTYRIQNQDSQPIDDWMLVVDTGTKEILIPVNEPELTPGEIRDGTFEFRMPITHTDSPSVVNLSIKAELLPGVPLSKPVSARLTIFPGDLQVYKIDAPQTIPAGESFPIAWSVRSDGQHGSENEGWKDSVFLSRDDTWDPSDILLGSSLQSIASLNDKGIYDAIHDVSSPTLQAPGDYYIIVVHDSHISRPDTDSGNDTLARRITIAPQPLKFQLVNNDDTGISADDNITFDNYPRFEFVIPTKGKLFVDFDGDSQSERELHFDSASEIVIDSHTSYDEGPQKVTARFESQDSIESSELSFSVDRTRPKLIRGPAAVRAPHWNSARFKFSEPVDALSLLGTVIFNREVWGESVDSARQISPSEVEFVFRNMTQPGTYSFYFNRATDLAGNRLANQRYDVELVDTVCFNTNGVDHSDVNADGVVSPIDALMIINQLTSLQSNQSELRISSSGFTDVDCSHSVTPMDALRVINRLSSDTFIAATAESESVATHAVNSSNGLPGKQNSRRGLATFSPQSIALTPTTMESSTEPLLANLASRNKSMESPNGIEIRRENVVPTEEPRSDVGHPELQKERINDLALSLHLEAQK